MCPGGDYWILGRVIKENVLQVFPKKSLSLYLDYPQMYGHEVKQEIILNLPTGLVATLATGFVVHPFNFLLLLWQVVFLVLD